ncbi:hypothetical protein B0H94_1018 [Salsuginibacillus halophilus]|uniref:Uncharacterized protein n=1 Tax=Salsuginibacillus halophilus TaxID=517424 RepID=A0A2P8HXX7_9BACI|nr:hypothetical protein [Salsuginibacillus halophilus]PSL51099.1 hypothetical protein B0H94_1018 [Salsuginibacillus halophilus]
MFTKIESRYGYDMYKAEYNDNLYIIQYNPERGEIEQMRPLSDGSTDVVAHLFYDHIASKDNETSH